MLIESKIKLIWKFSGNDANNIAKHHIKHLEEYVFNENLEIFEVGSEEIDVHTTISYIIVANKLLEKIKHDLKPHEGFIIS